MRCGENTVGRWYNAGDDGGTYGVEEVRGSKGPLCVSAGVVADLRAAVG